MFRLPKTSSLSICHIGGKNIRSSYIMGQDMLRFSKRDMGATSVAEILAVVGICEIYWGQGRGVDMMWSHFVDHKLVGHLCGHISDCSFFQKWKPVQKCRWYCLMPVMRQILVTVCSSPMWSHVCLSHVNQMWKSLQKEKVWWLPLCHSKLVTYVVTCWSQLVGHRMLTVGLLFEGSKECDALVVQFLQFLNGWTRLVEPACTFSPVTVKWLSSVFLYFWRVCVIASPLPVQPPGMPLPKNYRICDVFRTLCLYLSIFSLIIGTSRHIPTKQLFLDALASLRPIIKID